MTDSDQYTIYDEGEFRRADRHHYLTTLLKILRGELAASKVVEMDCRETCSRLGKEHPSCEPVSIREEDQKLVVDLINSRPSMYEEGAQFYLESIGAGDEDAVLCLLLPLLSNLRRLTPPPCAELLPRVMGRIAAMDSDKQPEERVFSKLLYIWTRAYNAVDCGMLLEKLAHFAAIPSVKRVAADGIRDHTFKGWPEGLPSSNASEVYFLGSSAELDAIKGFVSGFTGPTIFRQDWAPLWGREDLEWDHCRLSIVEGNRVVTTATEYEADEHGPHREGRPQIWRRMSGWSEGMNDIYDGTVHEWKTLLAVGER